MSMNTLLQKLISDNEQDRAAFNEWWITSSHKDKLDVWGRIQKVHSDPIDEVVSGLAQIAFGEMVERMESGNAN